MIPAIDALLATPRARALAETHGERATVDALREASGILRARLLANDPAAPARDDAIPVAILDEAASALDARAASRLRPVINATGVVIHTNLGRAPLSAAALDAVAQVGRGYATLEFDLETGARGSRHVHAERWLCELTGAEAALVANNTAAAITVTLAELATGREVVISRGELVEIGGGFRVPDVLRASGAILREVGTTNRTRVSDYAAAISHRTAALLRVHPSNFRMVGFTERPEAGALAALAARFDVPLIEDQGSGWLGLDVFDAEAFPAETRRVLAREPSVRDGVAAGVGLVAFSGDKLLGGPQCGIVVGRRALVERVRRHPLMRAVRVDKMTYAALEATLQAYRRGRALREVPVLAMLAVTPGTLAARAEEMVRRLSVGGVPASCRAGQSAIGGGTTPGETLPTTLVALPASDGADALLTRLRRCTTPVIARIVDDAVCLDLRTVAASDDGTLAEAVGSCLMLNA